MRTKPNCVHATIALAFLVIALQSGCDRKVEAQRYDFSGTVTWNGEIVPRGRVVLEPDASKKNTGPVAYATIMDGKYKTDPGKGGCGGPTIVRVVGFDGKATPESQNPEGQQLFPEISFPDEFPRSSASHDIKVPSSVNAKK